MTKELRLKKRFDITFYPTLYLIHKGEMFEYTEADRSVDKMAAFCLGGFEYNRDAIDKMVRQKPVPPHYTYFNQVVDIIKEGILYLRHPKNKKMVPVFGYGCGFGFLLGLLFFVTVNVLCGGGGGSTATNDKEKKA